MKDFLFQMIEETLHSNGYPTVWVEKSEPAPFPHLITKLHPDDKGRERSLLIKIDNEILLAPLDLEEQETPKESFVQFIIVLPFKIPVDSIWQVLRVLNIFNLSLPSPCFLLNERNLEVICHYSFLKPSSKISEQTLISLVGMVLLFLDVFSDSIEEVASGKSIENVIAEHAESQIKKIA